MNVLLTTRVYRQPLLVLLDLKLQSSQGTKERKKHLDTCTVCLNSCHVYLVNEATVLVKWPVELGVPVEIHDNKNMLATSRLVTSWHK